MPETDFSQAHAELTDKPWLAHLAGGAAAAAMLLAWILLVLGAPAYLAAYTAESVRLPEPAQLVLQVAQFFGGAIGIGMSILGAATTLLLWRRARLKGGRSTTLLFVIAGAMLVASIAIVIACATPLHMVQDLPDAR